jgi:mannose-1-phosphate guanylyltransferase
VLITIGIKPTGPSTGFGYIEAGRPRDKLFLQAKRFVEKPNLAKAIKYMASGRYYWNSGMFIWSVGSLEKAFRQHRPALADLMNKLAAGAKLNRVYPKLEKISIDYALMENATNIVMAQGRFKWDDVGSWTALEHHFQKDATGNVVIGSGEQVDASDNIIFSKARLTAVVGLSKVIVVQAGGVTLVCARDKAQDIKTLVMKLRTDGRFNDVL